MRAVAIIVPFCLLGACGPSRPATRGSQNPILEPVQCADRQRVNPLVLASFDVSDATPRPATSAGALATTDQRIAPLVTALESIDRAVEVCANNLANVQTTAFKARRSVSTPDGKAVFRTNCEQGSMENTSRQLDLAISGQGFFKVKTVPSVGGGFAYTRNGNFFVNHEGELVLGMGDGYHLVYPIVIPKGTTDVSVSADGQVEVVVAGRNAKQKVGQIQLFVFVNPEDLNPLGGSLFAEDARCAPPIESKPGEAGAGEVLQGFLEGSNVDATRERLRIRFLQNWRNTILKAMDDAK